MGLSLPCASPSTPAMATTSRQDSKGVEIGPFPSWWSENAASSAEIAAAVNADRSGGGACTGGEASSTISATSCSQGYHTSHHSPPGLWVARPPNQAPPPAPPNSSRLKYQQQQHQHLQCPHHQHHHYYYQYPHEHQNILGKGPPWPPLMPSVPLPPLAQPHHYSRGMPIPYPSPMTLQEGQERGEEGKRGSFQYEHQQHLEQLQTGEFQGVEMGVEFDGGGEQHQQKPPSASSPVGAVALTWALGQGLKPSLCLTFITYLVQGHVVVDRARSLLQAWNLLNGRFDLTRGHLHIFSSVLGFTPDKLTPHLPPVVSRLPPRVGVEGGRRGGGSPPASSAGGSEGAAGTAAGGIVRPPILLHVPGGGIAGEEGQEKKAKRPRMGGDGEEDVGGGGEEDHLLCSNFPAFSPPCPSFIPPLLPPLSSSPPRIIPHPMAVLRASTSGAAPDPGPRTYIQEEEEEEEEEKEEEEEEESTPLLLDTSSAGLYEGGGSRARGEGKEGGRHELPLDLPPPEDNAVMARCGVFWTMPIPEEGGREGGREGGCPPCCPEIICDESFGRMFLTEETIRRDMMEKGLGIEAIWECIIAPESLPSFYEGLVESGFCVPLSAVGCSRKVLKMLGRLEPEREGVATALDTVDCGNHHGDGGGRQGKKRPGFSGETAPPPAAAVEIDPPVLLPNEHEAFITTYVSEDGQHLAVTLDVVPLLSAEEEAEEEEAEEEEGGSISSFVSSLPTSPLVGSEDGSWPSLERM